MKMFFTYCLLFLSVLTAKSQVFVNHAATGTNDGSTWSNAFTDIQDALDASDPGDQIWIAAGTYIPSGSTPESSHFLLKTPLEIYGGFAGTETNLSERNVEANLTILSGDINGDDVPGKFLIDRSDNAHHIFIVDAGNNETVIDGLIFIGGTTRLDAYVPDSTDIKEYDRWGGGALYIRNTPAKIRNCLFRDNNGYRGSGIFARDNSATSKSLVIENSTFLLNSAIESGICRLGAWTDCVIKSCVFRENQAGSFGAGLALGNMNAIIEDCSFDENYSASQAGCCFIFHNAQSAILHPSFKFTSCQFNGNYSGSSGGAIRLNNFATGFDLTFDSCTFNNNYTLASNSLGGGIYVRDYADVDSNEISCKVGIDHTTFTENSSNFGGAVAVLASDDSIHIDVNQSNFSINSCPNTGSGGGLYASMAYSGIIDMRIAQTVFDGNTAPYGGGGLLIDNYFNTQRMAYVIDSCVFSNNLAESYGGGISSYVAGGPGPIGAIRNSQFLNNQGFEASGAIDSYGENLLIDNCLFDNNYTLGTLSPEYFGGGAMTIAVPEDVTVRNSTFKNNISENDGAAVFLKGGGNTRFENVLFHENEGNSTIFNGGNLILVNNTMVDNSFGLFLNDSSTTEIQNSIFKNTTENLITFGDFQVLSDGGNVSSDNTMSTFLTGNGNFADLNNVDPLLGADFIPLTGSPCIDAGNPEGIESSIDLAGNPRFYGNGIDIGAYESFLVAVNEAVWEDPGFTVYPNPVKDIVNITIESDWIGNINISVFDFSGHLVHKAFIVKSTREQTFQTNIGRLAPGEYVLLATEGDITYATSIFVQ